MPQLARPRDPGDIDAARALELIVLGLVKKVLIANFLATHLVDAVFENPGRALGAWRCSAASTATRAQIYGDFSGYTDIAIGSALLLGSGPAAAGLALRPGGGAAAAGQSRSSAPRRSWRRSSRRWDSFTGNEKAVALPTRLTTPCCSTWIQPYQRPT